MIKAAVVYVSSDLYSRLAGASIYSLYENNKKLDFHTYIISTGITKENMDKLDMVADEFDRQINYINGDEVVKEVSNWGGTKVL